MSSTGEPSVRSDTTGVTGDRSVGEKSSRSGGGPRGYKEDTPPADVLQAQEDQYQLELKETWQWGGTAREDGPARTAGGDGSSSVHGSSHRAARTPSPKLQVPPTSNHYNRYTGSEAERPYVIAAYPSIYRRHLTDILRIVPGLLLIGATSR
jgi:hypothetical protein